MRLLGGLKHHCTHPPEYLWPQISQQGGRRASTTDIDVNSIVNYQVPILGVAYRSLGDGTEALLKSLQPPYFLFFFSIPFPCALGHDFISLLLEPFSSYPTKNSLLSCENGFALRQMSRWLGRLSLSVCLLRYDWA